jgi:hypothetical protein
VKSNLGAAMSQAAAIAGTPVVLQFYTLLTSLDTPADIVTDFIVPFDCNVISWQMVTRVVATSGGTADADIDLQIGSTSITGAKKEGLTQGDFDTIGKIKAGGTITAANTIAAGGTFSVVCTESAVNFTAGAIDIYVYCLATALTGSLKTAKHMALA